VRASTSTRTALRRLAAAALLAALPPALPAQAPAPAPVEELPPAAPAQEPAPVPAVEEVAGVEEPLPATPAPPPAAPAVPSTAQLEMRLEPVTAPAPPPAAAPPRLVEHLPPAEPERALRLELEATLARTTQLYLVLDAPRRVVEIKARGIILDQLPLKDLALLRYQALVGGGAGGATPALPAVWKVVEGPGDFSRETIAPESLRPYVPEEEREEEPESGKKPETIVPSAPTSYRVRLESDWDLAIVDRSPHPGFFARYAQAVREGWAEIFGRPQERRPLIALSLAPEDARRLHHVFRTDLPILLVSGG
jgi:hypothetical protein